MAQTIELQPCVPGQFVEQTKEPINYDAGGTPKPLCGIFTTDCTPYGGVTVSLASVEGAPDQVAPLVSWALYGRFGRGATDLELLNSGTLAKLATLGGRGSIQTAIGGGYQGYELWLSHNGAGPVGTQELRCSILWSTTIPSPAAPSLTDGKLV